MWEVKNRTPYKCAGFFQRDANGREYWCTAIRATFDVHPDGTVRQASEQADVNLSPLFAGENNDVLLADDDVIPFAPVTDILIRGEAHPAEKAGKPAALSIEIGSMRKAAILYPPRRARLKHGKWRVVDVSNQQPASLGWESSFGGVLPNAPENQPPENPLGTGVWLRAPKLFDEGTEIDLPRIEGMGMDCEYNPHNSRSIGFGPVPRWWRERVVLAGQFNDDWKQNRTPKMPVDYDPRFECSAPQDQWPAKHFVGGENVCVQGFTGNSNWQFRLPQALFQIETIFRQRKNLLSARLARVDLWPSNNLVSMLWIGALACNGQDERIDTTRVWLRQLSGVTR